MTVIERLFRALRRRGPPRGLKRYEYTTGNIEFFLRLKQGESPADLTQEIKPRWTPGNERLWDEYDIESLIDTAEKRSHLVNQLLYSRVSVFRALREKGRDCSGTDPFQFFREVPDVAQRLRAMFARTLSAFGGPAWETQGDRAEGAARATLPLRTQTLVHDQPLSEQDEAALRLLKPK